MAAWLVLYGLVIHGASLKVDLQVAPPDLLLVAQDRHDLSTLPPLILDLHHIIAG